jgi:hypothetical protein
MRIVHLLYQIGDTIYCDVFLKGEILEDGENGENALNDAISSILKVDPNFKRKFYLLAFESKRKCYRSGEKIMRRRKMAEAYAKVLFPLEQYEPSRKTKDRIKKLICDETYKASKKRIIIDSSDGSDVEDSNTLVNVGRLSGDKNSQYLDDSDTIPSPGTLMLDRTGDEKIDSADTAKVKKPLQHVGESKTSSSPGTLIMGKAEEGKTNSNNEQDGLRMGENHFNNGDDAILREMCVQNSVPHLEEAITNIKMLISINYIQMGNFYVKADKVVLKTPFIHAFGDFIVNRHGYHQYKRDGYQERITRLTHDDLVC